MQTYSSQIEKQMVNLYGSLSEKDRRRYVAVEAAKLEHGRKRSFWATSSVQARQEPTGKCAPSTTIFLARPTAR